MGVVECRRVLQSVPEQPVEPDVRQPDQRELDAPVRVGEKTDGGESDRPDRSVQRVVEPSADPRAGQVAGEGQVGRQEEDYEQEPAVVLVEVDDESADEEREPLEPEEPPWNQHYAP